MKSIVPQDANTARDLWLKMTSDQEWYEKFKDFATRLYDAIKLEKETSIGTSISKWEEKKVDKPRRRALISSLFSLGWSIKTLSTIIPEGVSDVNDPRSPAYCTDMLFRFVHQADRFLEDKIGDHIIQRDIIACLLFTLRDRYWSDFDFFVWDLGAASKGDLSTHLVFALRIAIDMSYKDLFNNRVTLSYDVNSGKRYGESERQWKVEISRDELFDIFRQL